MFSLLNVRQFPFILVAIFLPCAEGFAQSPPEPYAAINRSTINYSGPGRDAAHDLKDSAIKIGLLVPLTGPRQAEGEALVKAAELALEDEAANPLPEGRYLVLLPRDESGLWGRASSEIVRLVVDEHALALITSTDGAAAHLAEQIGNKIGVPVLTLSTDKTTTQINLPWIFRLGPTDLAQAEAFAQDVYTKRGLKNVVLVTERDHDGRLGGEDFEKAAKQIGGREVAKLTLDAANADGLAKQVVQNHPQAVVLWTSPTPAANLVLALRAAGSRVPIYLCRKATQEPFSNLLGEHCRTCAGSQVTVAEEGAAPGFSSPALDVSLQPEAATETSPRPTTQEPGELLTIAPPVVEISPPGSTFERRYRDLTRENPSPAARQAYDAVRLIADALHRSGPNRARLRDSLSQVQNYAGVSGVITFDGAGNNQAPVTLSSVE